MKATTLRRSIFGVIVAGVTITALVNAASSGGEATARSKLVLMAPASAGGGWDSFAREAQQALKANSIVNNVQVVNVPGAGGTIGLSQLAGMPGRQDMMMATGGVMVGAVELAASGATMADATPIARLADDYNVLVVAADSEIETLDDFLEVWEADPGGTSIAGGSLGSIDHLLSGQIAQSIDIDPSIINYIAYAGGGSEVITAILSGTTTAGLPGYNEVSDQIEAGNLRPLAISSAERLPSADVPTFMEQGLDVEMANWRGYLAPPGISDELRDEFVSIVAEFRETDEWQDALDRNRWVDSYMVGDEFEEFLDDEIQISRQLVKDLGL
ncbi:MAG: tripartite tricarboxylate transporter substrate-binding protein [Microbacteriaceae bacterium]